MTKLTKISEREIVAEREVEVGGFYWSTNYERFVPMVDRREIDGNHTEELVESMGKYGYLPAFPILVTSAGVVWDGNHRLAAAEIANVAYCYRILDPVDGLDQAIMLADSAKPWTNEDYLHRYCVQGQQEYLRLQAFMTSRPYISAARAIEMCHYGNIVPVRKLFQAGKYVANDIPFANAVCDLAEYCGECGVDCWSQANFIATIKNLLGNPEFDEQVFRARVKAVGYKIKSRSSIADYMELMNEVYNFRARTNRVYLVQLHTSSKEYRSVGRFARK